MIGERGKREGRTGSREEGGEKKSASGRVSRSCRLMPMGACNGKNSTDTVPPGEEKPEEENGMQEPVAEPESADTENGTEEARTPSAADNKKLASQKSRSRRRGSVRRHMHTLTTYRASSLVHVHEVLYSTSPASIELVQSSDHHHIAT